MNSIRSAVRRWVLLPGAQPGSTVPNSYRSLRGPHGDKALNPISAALAFSPLALLKIIILEGSIMFYRCSRSR